MLPPPTAGSTREHLTSDKGASFLLTFYYERLISGLVPLLSRALSSTVSIAVLVILSCLWRRLHRPHCDLFPRLGAVWRRRRRRRRRGLGGGHLLPGWLFMHVQGRGENECWFSSGRTPHKSRMRFGFLGGLELIGPGRLPYQCLQTGVVGASPSVDS